MVSFHFFAGPGPSMDVARIAERTSGKIENVMWENDFPAQCFPGIAIMNSSSIRRILVDRLVADRQMSENKTRGAREPKSPTWARAPLRGALA